MKRFFWNIFDCATNYQRLVEWDIEHPFGNNLWFRDIYYYENDTSRHIYIAANNYLFKYEWPL